MGAKEPVESEHLEKQPKATDDLALAAAEWEDPRVAKIKRRVDIRLSVILALMYIVNQIDRTNLPNA